MTSFLTLVSFIGGLILLLYGLTLSGHGLEEAVGFRLRGLLTKLTQNRLLGALFGALLTAVIQSSSATTVLLVRLVNAGILSLFQAIPILLGADIGTTFTVQLIALDIHALAPLIMGIGFIIHSGAKRKGVKSIGAAILGFGFIFFGLHIIAVAIREIPASPRLFAWVTFISQWPILLLIFAALLTAIFHSSAATLGIALVMGAEGLLNLEGAIPIILGANIGTCGPALLASVKGTIEAKRVALAHILSKLAGALLLFPLMTPFATYIASTAETLPRQIANAHTLFNFFLLFLFLPILTPFSHFVTRLKAAPCPAEDPTQPQYLDPKLLTSPPFALEAAARESLRMAAIVQAMLKDVKQVFIQKNSLAIIDTIKQREEVVDHLNREIKLYLIGLSAKGLSEKNSAREMALLNVISHLENIGDIIDSNLLELGEKRFDQGIRFSDAGQKEIHLFHHTVCQDFDAVISAFESDKKETAQRVIDQREQFHHQGQALRAAHIERLHQAIPYAIESSAIHLDLITHFSRIKSHITAIAHTVVEQV
jgi:phosphate:Na+ symporter